MTSLKRFLNDESGATAIEYGLIAALVAVVIIGAVTLLGESIDTQFRRISGAIAGPGGGGAGAGGGTGG